MKGILVEAKVDGDQFRLVIPSEYNRLRLREMVKHDHITLYELKPRVRASKAQRGYLEGAVIPAYGHWQYQLDPRKPADMKRARELFKLDFHYDVVRDRDGSPKRVPKSLKSSHRDALDAYMQLAPENGMPIPNESLYKTWRDEYSMDTRWENYWDFLDHLGLECDSMPSAQELRRLL